MKILFFIVLLCVISIYSKAQDINDKDIAQPGTARETKRPPIDSTSDTIKTLNKKVHPRIALLAASRRRKLWIALSFTPQSVYSRILIDEAGFDGQKQVDYRLQQSRPVYGYNAGLAVGWWLNDRNRIYLDFSYVQMGFASKNSAVDWTTGYSAISSYTLYHFNFIQTGFGYTYVHASKKRVNVVVDMGLSINSKNRFYQNDAEIPEAAGFKNPVVTGNLGVGANINLSRWLDFELVPNFTYSLSAVHTANLKTYLNGFGITGRLGLNFFNQKDTSKG